MKLLFSTLDKVADGNSMMCCMRQAKEGLKILKGCLLLLKLLSPHQLRPKGPFLPLAILLTKSGAK